MIIMGENLHFDGNSSNLLLAIFSFENSNFIFVLDEVLEKYQWFGFVCGFVYICAVFGIQWWMRDRTGYELKLVAVLWNTFLALLNTIATARMMPHVIRLVMKNSFYESICVDRSFMFDPIAGFWVRTFPFIKIIELGDTILIVLQKRRLLTYYWTHHFGALLITWYLYPFYPVIAFWISVIINLTHIPVYVYGLVRSCGIFTPKLFPACLLLLEVAHMIIGILICSVIYYYMAEERYCAISFSNITILLLMYSFCLVLSSTVFYERFLARSKKISENMLSSTITTVLPGV